MVKHIQIKQHLFDNCVGLGLNRLTLCFRSPAVFIYFRDDSSKPYALSLANKSLCGKLLKVLHKSANNALQVPFYQYISSIFRPLPITCKNLCALSNPFSNRIDILKISVENIETCVYRLIFHIN